MYAMDAFCADFHRLIFHYYAKCSPGSGSRLPSPEGHHQTDRVHAQQMRQKWRMTAAPNRTHTPASRGSGALIISAGPEVRKTLGWEGCQKSASLFHEMFMEIAYWNG